MFRYMKMPEVIRSRIMDRAGRLPESSVQGKRDWISLVQGALAAVFDFVGLCFSNWLQILNLRYLPVKVKVEHRLDDLAHGFLSGHPVRNAFFVDAGFKGNLLDANAFQLHLFFEPLGGYRTGW